MSLNLNFDNVETGFTIVDEGTFTFIVEDAKEKDNKAGDSTNVVINSTVVDSGENNGRKVLTFFSMKENALWNFKLFLEALFGELPSGDFDLDLDDLVGKTFVATVEHTQVGTQVYANLTAYAPNS